MNESDRLVQRYLELLRQNFTEVGVQRWLTKEILEFHEWLERMESYK